MGDGTIFHLSFLPTTSSHEKEELSDITRREHNNTNALNNMRYT